MKIFLSAGHSQLKNGTYTSAMGLINEHEENVIMVNKIANELRKDGHEVDTCIIPKKTLSLAKEEANYKLTREKSKSYDLCIEIHFNAFNKTAKGTEVLYYSENGKKYATIVQDKLSTLFTNRGIKKRDNLYILTKTKSPAILIEVCFCDNKEDVSIYNTNKDKIARLIADGISNKTTNTNTISKGETFYRVCVGSFNNRVNAEKKVEELKKMGISDAFITTFIK